MVLPNALMRYSFGNYCELICKQQKAFFFFLLLLC